MSREQEIAAHTLEFIKAENAMAMAFRPGDIIKLHGDGQSWRVERVGPGDSVHAISLDGSRQCWPTKDQVEANYTFLERCAEGDVSALVQLTPAERTEFEAKTWQLFFARHIGIADCQATRSMLTDFLHGDFVSLAALEQGLEKLCDRLPTRQL